MTTRLILDDSSKCGRDSDRCRSGGCAAVNRLPDSILHCIGEYLPIPSRAMMAAAFSRSACFNSDTLDFDVICHSLASKLTDDDIESMLISIGAFNRLKVLKLHGCKNITGVGLTPIMNSIVLEQIDLSTSYDVAMAGSDHLFSTNFPFLFQLEQDVVIPILDSIIAAKGTALKHLQLPLVWRKNKSAKLTSFLERFDETLSNRTCNCVECKRDFSACSWVNSTKSSSHWGLQNLTCYNCTKNICEECEFGFCRDCKRQFCEHCCDKQICDSCSSLVCGECECMESCEQCGNIYCDDCMAVPFCECCERSRCVECVVHNFCSRCGKSNCGECANEHNVEWCDFCEEDFCNDCRLELWQDGRLDCLGCRGMLLPRIMHDNQALCTEIEMLKFLVVNVCSKISPDSSIA